MRAARASLARVKWWWIFAFGGAGAVLRYGVSGFVQMRTGDAFPWGTLSVNVAGCFAIGLLATAFEERSVLSPDLRLALLVGLFGGFTTLSTFGLEPGACSRTPRSRARLRTWRRASSRACSRSSSACAWRGGWHEDPA